MITFKIQECLSGVSFFTSIRKVTQTAWWKAAEHADEYAPFTPGNVCPHSKLWLDCVYIYYRALSNPYRKAESFVRCVAQNSIGSSMWILVEIAHDAATFSIPALQYCRDSSHHFKCVCSWVFQRKEQEDCHVFHLHTSQETRYSAMMCCYHRKIFSMVCTHGTFLYLGFTHLMWAFIPAVYIVFDRPFENLQLLSWSLKLISCCILTDPCQSEVMGDPHIMAEHQLGLKFLWIFETLDTFLHFNKTRVKNKIDRGLRDRD